MTEEQFEQVIAEAVEDYVKQRVAIGDDAQKAREQGRAELTYTLQRHPDNRQSLMQMGEVEAREHIAHVLGMFYNMIKSGERREAARRKAADNSD